MVRCAHSCGSVPAVADRQLAEGFTVATVASDLVHLKQASAAHLEAARKAPRPGS